MSPPDRAFLARRLGLAYRRWALRRRTLDATEVHDWAISRIRRRRYCLVVTDELGGASARVVEPFRPDRDGVIRFGTDPHSRKARDIVREGRCLLVYQDDRRRACVTVECTATVEPPSARPWFKASWSAFWPDGPDADYVVIRCVPQAMEVWAGFAVIAPAPFGRRTRRIEQHEGTWTDALS